MQAIEDTSIRYWVRLLYERDQEGLRRLNHKDLNARIEALLGPLGADSEEVRMISQEIHSLIVNDLAAAIYESQKAFLRGLGEEAIWLALGVAMSEFGVVAHQTIAVGLAVKKLMRDNAPPVDTPRRRGTEAMYR